jgi:AAA+ superfamily predicted ATPase
MSADDRTLALLRQLVEAQPDNWEARSHLIELLLTTGRAADAAALVHEAKPPQTPSAQLLVGRVLAAKDGGEAIAHYRAMIARDKRCAPAHDALARLLLARGLKQDARHHYGLAVVIDERFEDAAFEAALEGVEAPAAPRQEAVPRQDAAPPAPASTPSRDRAPSAEELERALDLGLTSGANLPRIGFADVGGMEALKERIRMHVVYPFRNPETFQRFKKRPGGGILLYGPPGCGKTYLARATAGECGARFISVSVADVLGRWLGESEGRLRDLFATARQHAPTVLFLDEIDGLGMSRRDARGSGISTVINQLLIEMDGLHASNDNVIVLAATNAPWAIDSAFRRPGRFDRVVFVPPPDPSARRSILEIHLRGVPQAALDLDALLKATRGFSGADLRAVVERACEVAISEEMRQGRPTLLTQDMLRSALRESKSTTQEWLDTARSYASYGNRDGQYDEVAKYLESRPE